MAIVKTMNVGGAIVNFHDDFIPDRETSIERLNRAGNIIYQQLRAQHIAKMLKEAGEKDGTKEDRTDSL
jgi:hypothetical protein